MPAPVPPTKSPTPRARVPVFVLVATIIGAFAWGLIMFVVGRGSVVADQSQLNERELAQAQLVRIDRALDGNDDMAAERLIHEAHMPETAAWSAALALRRQRLSSFHAAPTWTFLQLSPHPLQSDHWLAIARDRKGMALITSQDAGAHWTERQRLSIPAAIHRSRSATFVTVTENQQLGWYSNDRDVTWKMFTRPSTEKPITCGLTGDGRVVVATSQALHIAASDGAWTAILPTANQSLITVKTIVALSNEALILATFKTIQGQVLMISMDTGVSWFQAPSDLAALCDQQVTSVTLNDMITVSFANGKRARFSLSDGAFLGILD